MQLSDRFREQIAIVTTSSFGMRPTVEANSRRMSAKRPQYQNYRPLSCNKAADM